MTDHHSPSDITIQKVTAVDQALVSAIDTLMNSMPYSVGQARTVESLKLVTDNPDAYWYVALAGPEQKVAGTVFMIVYQGLSNRRSMVENLAVDPTYRRRGIARALMERVISDSRGLGFKNLRVVTELDGPAAKLMDELEFMHYDEMRLYEREAAKPLPSER